MKIKKIFMLSIVCTLLLYGCEKTDNIDYTVSTIESSESSLELSSMDKTKNTKKTKVKKQKNKNKTTGEKPSKKLVQYSYKNIQMSISLPKKWDFFIHKQREATKQKEGSSDFGIDFWPEERPELKLYLYYQWETIGLCGTGVTIEPITLNKKLSATAYYEEIEDNFWYMIVFDKNKALVTNTKKKLWEEYKEEIFDILSTIKWSEVLEK